MTSIDSIVLNEGGSKLLLAINFAAIKHIHQKRKGDDSPYINHPIGVATSILKEGGITDSNVLIAAVLHEYVPLI